MHPFARLKIRTKLNLLGRLRLPAAHRRRRHRPGGDHQSSKNALYHVYNDHLVVINQLNEIRNHQMRSPGTVCCPVETNAFEIMGHAAEVRSHVFQIENLLQEPLHRPSPGGGGKQRYDAFIAARTAFGTQGVFP